MYNPPIKLPSSECVRNLPKPCAEFKSERPRVVCNIDHWIFVKFETSENWISRSDWVSRELIFDWSLTSNICPGLEYLSLNLSDSQNSVSRKYLFLSNKKLNTSRLIQFKPNHITISDLTISICDATNIISTLLNTISLKLGRTWRPDSIFSTQKTYNGFRTGNSPKKRRIGDISM